MGCHPDVQDGVRLRHRGARCTRSLEGAGRLATAIWLAGYKMMGKFRLGNNAELVQFAIRQGLIT